jgi:sporulation protein YlmC with PRC-barrel domain
MMKRNVKVWTRAAALLMGAGLAAGSYAQTDDKPTKQPPSDPGQTYKPGEQTEQPKDRPTTDEHRKMAREMHGPITLVPTDWLEGATIRGTNDEKLGDVKDLIISRAQRRVTFALVGHGGVLKIGEKVVAVPFRAFTWNPDRKVMTLAMTADQLNSAPNLESGEWKTLGDPGRTEPIYSHFNVTEDRAMSDDAWMPRKNPDDANRRDRDGQPAATPSETSRLRPDEFRVLRASDIEGKDLVGSDGRDVGKVDDLIVDAGSGRIALVAVTFGGVLGIGEDRVAVPYTAFDVNKDGRLYVTTIDRDTIKSAPRLKEKDWGELRNPSFAADVYRHYGQHAKWLDSSPMSDTGMGAADQTYKTAFKSGTPRELTGTIQSVDEREPMSGMPKVTVLTLKTNGQNTVTVQVCPKSHLSANNIQLRDGDTVTIKGRQAMVDGQDVLIATQITPSNGRSITVRQDDGETTWR